MGKIAGDGGSVPAYDDDAFWINETVRRTMHLTQTTRASIGQGATVPASYVQAQARALFLGALYRWASEVIDELYTKDLYRMFADWQRAFGEWYFESGAHSVHGKELPDTMRSHPAYAVMNEIRDRELAYIQDWQARHHLEGDWILWAAFDSLVMRNACGYPEDPAPELVEWFPNGLPIYLSDLDASRTVFDGLEVPPQPPPGNPFKLRMVPAHKLRERPVFLDDLKHPAIDTDDHHYEDEGDFATFTPRGETVDDAVTRIMPELERRLRAALERMEDDDRQLNDAMKPVTFRKVTAFEWLVRYQVLEESQRQISYSLAEVKWGHEPDWERKHNPYDNTGYVGKEIKRVARLIGLTLREPQRGEN